MVQHSKPLYRRVNTTAHGVHHLHGGDFRASRGKDDRSTRGAMHGGQRRGLDYTPLFKFLLSRVGDDWDQIHSAALARLDREEPIYWLVARSEAERQPKVRPAKARTIAVSTSMQITAWLWSIPTCASST